MINQRMDGKIDMFPTEGKNNCLGSWHPSASALSALGSTNLESQFFEHSLHFAWIRYDTASLRYPMQQSFQTLKIPHWIWYRYPVIKRQTPKSASEIRSWHVFVWHEGTDPSMPCFLFPQKAPNPKAEVLWDCDLVWKPTQPKQVWLRKPVRNQTTLHHDSDIPNYRALSHILECTLLERSSGQPVR